MKILKQDSKSFYIINMKIIKKKKLNVKYKKITFKE